MLWNECVFSFAAAVEERILVGVLKKQNQKKKRPSVLGSGVSSGQPGCESKPREGYPVVTSAWLRQLAVPPASWAGSRSPRRKAGLLVFVSDSCSSFTCRIMSNLPYHVAELVFTFNPFHVCPQPQRMPGDDSPTITWGRQSSVLLPHPSCSFWEIT